MIVVKTIVNGVPTWKLPTASSGAKFIAAEAKTIYDNMPGMSYEVQAVDKLYYFVHNETKVDDSQAYDTRDHEVPAGEKALAHPLQAGEVFLTNCGPESPAVGTVYGVTAEGKVG